VSEDNADLIARVQALPELVNGDAWLLQRGRFLTVDMLMEVGADPFHLSFVSCSISRSAMPPNSAP
jgi:hypothetical protein